MSGQGRRPALGFVLPLTIWILVAVAVVATFLAQRVQKALQLAQSRQSLNDVQLQLSDARAEILFRLGTQGMSACGLGEVGACVALDDRPYAMGASVLQLQDARGLLDVNLSSDLQLDRLLQGYAVRSETRARLIDALRDYVDADSLRRLNGAEAPDYSARGMPPPRNAPLLLPLELKAVMGWADVPALWQGELPISDLFSVGRAVALNPNTAPLPLLRLLDGMTAEAANALVERRKLEPVSAELVDRMVGGGLLQIPPAIITFPADTVRVTQRTPGLPWGLRYNVKLTPRDADAPWRITYFHRLELPASAARAVSSPEPTKLPPRPALAASSPFANPI